ncbi:hypothetical protein ABZV93_25530 [Actinopolymorpha sp. NPDC004070]|uniref:hypothetical protein n=1 Tax=Actinopolymorpha sp. NPDC004070 TaxID=3154548 RepID=UPI0033A14CAB
MDGMSGGVQSAQAATVPGPDALRREPDERFGERVRDPAVPLGPHQRGPVDGENLGVARPDAA